MLICESWGLLGFGFFCFPLEDAKLGIIVKIDKGEYNFYTTQEIPGTAWTNEDSKVIFAMKKGLELVVKGESSRGTITNDEYTLKGFTAEYNKLIEEC